MRPKGIFGIIGSAFVIKATGAALAVLMFVAIGRASTLRAFGDFAFGFATAQLLAVLVGLGSETTALRKTSAALATQRVDAARHHAAGAMSMVIVGSIGTAFLGLIIIIGGADPGFASAICALAALLALSETQSAILRGYGGVGTALVPREIAWRIAVFIMAGVIWAAGGQAGAVLWLWLASASLGVVVMWQWLGFTHRPSRAEIAASWAPRVYIRAHWQIWAIAVLNGIGAQLPILVVRLVMNAETTALLFAAMKITAVIALPLVASGPVVAPQIARAWARGDLPGLQRIGTQTAAFTSTGALIGVVFVLLAGPMLLGIFGPEFIAARNAMVVLAGGQLIAALLGPTGFAMLMMGYERIALIYLGLSTLAALALTLGLTLGFGLMGAAIGISSLVILNKGACYAFLWRRHGIHMSLIGGLAPLRISSDPR